MFNQKETKAVKNSIICITFFSLLAIVWFYINKDVIFDNSTDFYELESSDKGIQKDKYVSLEVNCVLGNYAETKHYTNLIPTGKDQHFILLLANNDIISLKANNKKQIRMLNDICDDTINYLEHINEGSTATSLTKKMTVKGVIHTINPEIEDYYVQVLNQIGISYENHTIYYVELDAASNRTSTISYLLIILIFVVLSVLGLIKNKRK